MQTCLVEGASARGSLRPGAGEEVPLYAFLLSTAVIFVAELGDKSQLMAMTFAARYRARDVIIGITAATAFVHLVSVGIGYFIGDAFEGAQGTIELIAGLAFLAFALWTMRGDELTDEEADKARKSRGLAIVAVGTAFFLAELGDKTMLATITLATQEGWFGTWIGSTVGMVAADALAIGVGAVLGRRLPEKSIKYGAAALFAIFGLLLVAGGLGWL
jgi:putative Ca2+/H+ antiporter (TMEM165/GDT1 family)